MTHRKYFIISLILILTAVAVITLSDYWMALNSMEVQTESFTEGTAVHLSRVLFQGGLNRNNLDDPGLFAPYAGRIEFLSSSFNLLNVKIITNDKKIVFSLEKDLLGKTVEHDSYLRTALKGTAVSTVFDAEHQERTYGNLATFPILETYVPIYHPENGSILGAYVISQDYRPYREKLIKETARSGATHFILMLVFAGLFFRYGRLTSRFIETQHRSLIRDLEERVEDRTLELKRSRDRVSDLLEHKEEMFRNLMIADEYKKDFMGLVSHELRTPLTIIKGYLTMIRDGDLGPVYSGLQDSLGTCLEESTKLESLINNILDLSQLERGGFDLSSETFDVHELLSESVANMSTEVGNRKDDIKIEISPEITKFTSDRIKILQVVQQFLSNALKFSSPGSVITMKASPSHRGLLLSVIDEGVGIPESQVGEIFNIFYQVDISSTRSYEGSGLGLAIAHRIAQILGGRSWVESEEGAGSTFYFEVPHLDISREAEREMDWSQSLVVDRKPMRIPSVPRSILLLDDDEDYLFLLRRILIDGGYTVEMCRDGLEGLNQIFAPDHPNHPALIILDIRMPNINGIDFLKILRRNLSTRQIPVIVVSALGQEAQVQEGINAGANAYLVKPFDPDTLMARINFLLGKQNPASE